jgi:hypothetical protein
MNFAKMASVLDRDKETVQLPSRPRKELSCRRCVVKEGSWKRTTETAWFT